MTQIRSKSDPVFQLGINEIPVLDNSELSNRNLQKLFI